LFRGGAEERRGSFIILSLFVSFANSSLTALNLLRIEDRAWALSQGLNLRERVCSIGPLKLLKYNRLVLNRFIASLDGELKPEKIKQACEKAYQTGLLVA
jgi:hypothetical protein